MSAHFLTEVLPLLATTCAVLWGASFLLCGASTEYDRVQWSGIGLSTWLAIACLGVFGTALGFAWWYDAVAALGSSRTAVFNNLGPVFAVALSGIVLEEPLVPSQIAGGTLVLAGVLLVNK